MMGEIQFIKTANVATKLGRAYVIRHAGKRLLIFPDRVDCSDVRSLNTDYTSLIWPPNTRVDQINDFIPGPSLSGKKICQLKQSRVTTVPGQQPKTQFDYVSCKDRLVSLQNKKSSINVAFSLLKTFFIASIVSLPLLLLDYIDFLSATGFIVLTIIYITVYFLTSDKQDTDTTIGSHKVDNFDQNIDDNENEETQNIQEKFPEVFDPIYHSTPGNIFHEESDKHDIEIDIYPDDHM